MKIAVLSSLMLGADAFIISGKEANQVLGRERRENPQINENSKFFGLVEGADDLERECIEGKAPCLDITCLNYLYYISRMVFGQVKRSGEKAFLRKMQR